MLTNPTNHPLASVGNGPVDFSDPTLPVLRALRAGGDPDFTSDPYNGFMPDSLGPLVIGSSPITIVDAPVQIEGVRFMLPTLMFASSLCVQTPEGRRRHLAERHLRRGDRGRAAVGR